MTRLIPPVLWLVLTFALVPLAYFHPEGPSLWSGGGMLWLLPFVPGVVILLWARVHFNRFDAEIHTFKRPRVLLTGGIYRFSRNPMYLGFLLLLLSAALFVNTHCALIGPLLFFGAASLWYIPHEEATCRAEFGAEFEAYTRQARRWI